LGDFVFVGVGLPETAIIGIAVAGGAVLVVAIVLIVIFGVPSIRKRVLPHRDRKTWKKGGVY